MNPQNEAEAPVSRPPLPPFTYDTACRKVEFLQGRDAIQAFLTRKWARELNYRLIKDLWAFRENRIAVRFAYEWTDDSGHWFRSYGNENWEFDEHGLMRLRLASINDLPIAETERRYRWPQGRRPDDHRSLSDLGL
jgi:nuclear transport factor 2 (NTF2) superfamily protein